MQTNNSQGSAGLWILVIVIIAAAGYLWYRHTENANSAASADDSSQPGVTVTGGVSQTVQVGQ